MAKLRRGHFAAIGAKLVIELAAGAQAAFFGLARAGQRDHLVFERGEALFEILQIVKKRCRRPTTGDPRRRRFHRSPLACGFARRWRQMGFESASSVNGAADSLWPRAGATPAMACASSQHGLRAIRHGIHVLAALLLGTPFFKRGVDARAAPLPKARRRFSRFPPAPSRAATSEKGRSRAPF